MRTSQPHLPTLLFIATVPALVALHQTISIRITKWEKHTLQSTHDLSLILKIAPVMSMVSFFGLILTAGIYLPFGHDVMTTISPSFTTRAETRTTFPTLNERRLRDQLFEFLVPLQISPLVGELVAPFAIRWVGRKWSGPSRYDSISKAPEKDINEESEKEFIGGVAHELTLPVYSPLRKSLVFAYSSSLN